MVKSHLLTVRQLSQLKVKMSQRNSLSDPNLEIWVKSPWVGFISLGQLTQIKTYLFCGFPHLGDLLEPELIGGELVGEAGGSGGKLLGHIPNTIRKLKSNKKLCKENNCQTLKSKFTITV